jgi:endonuclease/exonuclease/phosphatase family metal-dependent hydrolase
VTPPLAGSLGAARVYRESRGWQQASDHVPVMIELGD